jgi:magnesium-transporting ATPase (P-type)
VISLTIYGWALRTYGEGAHARTLAMLALIGVQIGHTFNCRSRTRFAFDGALRNPHLWFATATVILLQALVSTVPSLTRVLGIVRPVSADVVAFAIALVVPIVAVDLQKAIAGLARRRRVAEVFG